MNDIKENSKPKAKRVSPCFNCPDRGQPFCHHDDCPHGWKEYQNYVQSIRDARACYAHTWAYESGRDKAITKMMKYKQRSSRSRRSK